MEIQVISSGSHGNCVLYFKQIAIDMGITFSKISPYVDDIKILLLTHEHL